MCIEISDTYHVGVVRVGRVEVVVRWGGNSRMRPIFCLQILTNKTSLDFPYSVPFKVVWTNYELAIIYSCSQLRDDGTCRRKGEQLHVLSRTPDVSTSSRIILYNIIRRELCVDIFDLVEPAKEGITRISF